MCCVCLCVVCVHTLFDSGTPSEDIWPGFSKLPYAQRMRFKLYPSAIRQKMFSATTEAGFDLLMRLLSYDPGESPHRSNQTKKKE